MCVFFWCCVFELGRGRWEWKGRSGGYAMAKRSVMQMAIGCCFFGSVVGSVGEERTRQSMIRNDDGGKDSSLSHMQWEKCLMTFRVAMQQ